MARGGRLSVLLMTTDLLAEDAPGFHRIVFRLDGGGRSIGLVTVQISRDALRKLRRQIARVTHVRPDDAALLKGWAKWALIQRIESRQPFQPLLTITASDVDEFGSYASEIRRGLRAG